VLIDDAKILTSWSASSLKGSNLAGVTVPRIGEQFKPKR
jgi:hypothetical protein